MKKAVLILALITFLIPVTGLAKKPKDILGTYAITGFNPGVQTSGEPSYSGTVDISQSGGAYVISWTVDGKKKSKKGVGILTDKILAVGMDNGSVGSFKLEKNTLKGAWSPSGGGVFGYEVWERQ